MFNFHFDKDPKEWGYDDAWFISFFMALFGSFVNWATTMRAIKAKATWVFFIMAVLELFYDMIVGAFVGLVTIMAMYRVQADVILIGIVSGAAGHAAPRLLFIIRKFMLKRAGNYLDDNF